MKSEIVVTEHALDDFEHVTLESQTAEVIPHPALDGRDMEWLMKDVMSTPYAEVIREV